MLFAVGLLAGIAFLVLRGAVADHQAADRAVAMEATPSIVAAQKTKAGLAAMHAHAARGLLGVPGAAKEYEQQRVKVTDALLAAARNVTYPGEEDQIRTLLNELSRYERAIAAAVALSARDQGSGFAGLAARARDRAEVIYKVREADGILRDRLAPAADRLDEINYDELKTVYDGHSRSGRGWETGIVAIGIVLVAALVRIQIYLRRQFRRSSSPPVVGAAALAGGFLVFAFVMLTTSRAELRVAKEDAFESIDTLRKAKADGYVALAAGHLRLLDPEQAEAYGKWRDEAMARIAKLPDMVDFKQLVADTGKLSLKLKNDKQRLARGFKGYLRKELENVTFEGEEAAALAALASFGEFVGELSPETLLRGGAEVVVLRPPDLATLATKFARFDADLDRVIGINEDAFNREIGRGEKVLDRCGYPNPLAMAGVFALTALGLYPRLREYAI
jgi:hypothetical protein